MNDKKYKNKLFNNTFKHILRIYFINGVKKTLCSIPKAFSAVMLWGLFSFVLLITDKFFTAKRIFEVLNTVARISNLLIIIVVFLQLQY